MDFKCVDRFNKDFDLSIPITNGTLIVNNQDFATIDLAPVENNTDLREIIFEDILAFKLNLESLVKSPELVSLNIRNCSRLKYIDLSPLGSSPNLETITIGDCEKVSFVSIGNLSDCPRLRLIDFSNLKHLAVDLSSLWISNSLERVKWYVTGLGNHSIILDPFLYFLEIGWLYPPEEQPRGIWKLGPNRLKPRMPWVAEVLTEWTNEYSRPQYYNRFELGLIGSILGGGVNSEKLWNHHAPGRVIYNVLVEFAEKNDDYSYEEWQKIMLERIEDHISKN